MSLKTCLNGEKLCPYRESIASNLSIQACLGDIAVRFQITAIKRVTQNIWLPNAYKRYVYTAIAMF
jgi:hypothetical protein